MSKRTFKENLPKDPKAADLEGKVQTDKQDATTSDKLDVKAPVDPAIIKEVQQPKPAVNTRQAAEVVAAGSTSTGVGGAPLLRATVVFGGSAGAIRDDESATTREDRPYRSGTRMGKRIDPITRKIDTVLPEIFKTEIKQSKPLAESGEKQGYNGNYFNDHAITQKVNGGSPADPLFERSIDMISTDLIYFPQGQLISGRENESLTIHSWSVEDDQYERVPTPIPLGNYLPRWLDITLDNGVLTGLSLTCDNIRPDPVDEATARLASDSYVRFKNLSELDRNNMITKAGNESDPSWSALGDALIDSTDQNRFLRLFEATVGDFIYMAARNLQLAKSFQINKAGKDGARAVGPMAEAMNRLVALAGYGADGAVAEADGYNLTFNRTAYLNGGAGLYVAINDSLPKYTTKGKLLSLPLSIGTAAQTALSNMGPFVMDDVLAALASKNELFSTIDGPYDPVKPVVITDGKAIAPLIHPFVGGYTTGDDINTLHFDRDSTFTVYTMHYENMRNKYNIDIQNYFAMGLWNFLSDRASRLFEAVRTNRDDHGQHVIHIPVASTLCGFSLWDALVAASTPYMVEARLTTMTELLKYEKNFGYPYSGVTHLSSVDVTAAENFTFTDCDSALTAAMAKPVAANRIIMPELFWATSTFEAQAVDHRNGIGATVVLPSYFVQNQFAYDNDLDLVHRNLILTDEAATMAYPSIRTGSNLSFADTIYGMSEEDYRLSLDRMVVYPGYTHTEADFKFAYHRGAGEENSFDAYTYKYGMSGDGIPTISYMVYDTPLPGHEVNTHCILTVGDILRTPRELGYIMTAPAGVVTPTQTSDLDRRPNYVSADSSYLAVSGPSFSLKVYHTENGHPQAQILEDDDIQIGNNASFRNVWEWVTATPGGANRDLGFTVNATTGDQRMLPFVYGSYITGYGDYDPEQGTYDNAEHHVGQVGDDGIASIHKYLWTRLQRLPFVINPFDVNTANITTVPGDAEQPLVNFVNNVDPFDFMYIFGLCGFRASDYTQLVFDRNKERVVKGMNYTVDPFADKSMLLK